VDLERLRRDADVFLQRLVAAGSVCTDSSNGQVRAPSQTDKGKAQKGMSAFIQAYQSKSGSPAAIQHSTTMLGLAGAPSAGMAYLVLATLDLALRIAGFQRFYRMVRGWRNRPARVANSHSIEEVCAAVGRAASWYPKRATCLQTSATAVYLLRKRGIAAELVIGCRRQPFSAHAWVEVAAEVVNDSKQVAESFHVIDRW